MPDNDPRTYSISIRVKRTIVDCGYVSVPVANAIMRTGENGNVAQDEKGHAHIDPEKLTLQAIAWAREPSVKWFRESEQIEPHPIQKPPDEIVSRIREKN
jgi:hypothetical protein